MSVENTSREAMLGALGERLQVSREAEGITREALVEALGYAQIERGMAKVRAWEEGGSPPRGDRIDKLRRLLRLPWTEARILHSLLDDEVRAEAKGLGPETYLDWLSRLEEEQLLAENLELFEARRDEILMDPELSSVRVGGATAGLAYLGGGSLSLGRLLTVWSMGLGGFGCPCCGEHFHAMRLAGSPLSGSHEVRGFCREDRRIRSQVLPTGERIGPLAGATWQAARAVDITPTPWDLQRLVRRLRPRRMS